MTPVSNNLTRMTCIFADVSAQNPLLTVVHFELRAIATILHGNAIESFVLELGNIIKCNRVDVLQIWSPDSIVYCVLIARLACSARLILCSACYSLHNISHARTHAYINRWLRRTMSSKQFNRPRHHPVTVVNAPSSPQERVHSRWMPFRLSRQEAGVQRCLRWSFGLQRVIRTLVVTLVRVPASCGRHLYRRISCALARVTDRTMTESWWVLLLNSSHDGCPLTKATSNYVGIWWGHIVVILMHYFHWWHPNANSCCSCSNSINQSPSSSSV